MPTQNCKHPTCNGEFCRRPKKEKKVYYLKRSPIKRKVSEKLKGRLVQYKEARIVYLKANPLCQAKLEGCKKKATEIHHAAGRDGERLNATAYWVPICRNCHIWVTEHSKEAIELGLSVRKIT